MSYGRHNNTHKLEDKYYVLHTQFSIRIIVPKHLKRNYLHENTVRIQLRRSQWSRGIRRGSGPAHLLELWVQSSLGSRRCLSLVSAACCAGRGRAITRSEESYRALCVQWMWSRRPARGDHDPESGRSATQKKKEDNYVSLAEKSRLAVRIVFNLTRGLHLKGCIFLVQICKNYINMKASNLR